MQSGDGAIDCLMLCEMSAGSAAGQEGALHQQPLDGGYLKTDDKFQITFPASHSHFGHNAVRIGDVLPFHGFGRYQGCYKVIGPTTFPGPGFQLKSVKVPVGFPNLEKKNRVVWVDGWSRVGERGTLELTWNPKLKQVSFKLQLVHPSDRLSVIEQGVLREGVEFDISGEKIGIGKIYPPN